VVSPRIPLFQRRGHPLHPLTRVPRGLVKEFLRDYLAALGSPRAIGVWMLFESGTADDLVQLVTLNCDPLNYNNVEDFRAAYAATKLFSKCRDLKTGLNLSEIAVESAREAESRCHATNARFRDYLRGVVIPPYDDEIQLIRKKIKEILGPAPRELSFSGWSKGRTTSAFGSDLSLIKKFGSRPDVTASALRHALRAVRDSPVWGAALLQSGAPVSVTSRDCMPIVQGNVMLTVPKSAKTDRVICYEPHMNIMLQLSVGRMMRGKLARHGVNLDDQSINQRRARLGSKTGHLATIDLRSASDTVAREVVDQLLPLDWVCLLNDLRSKYTIWPDGLARQNEKFSSMGNGFTFELESLLFYAICSAVARDVSVYGDDIILPSEDFEKAVKLLDFFGFEVNSSKSFSTGYFRESCGMEVFRGVAVSPVYLRSLPKTVDDVLKFHNRVSEFVGTDPWPRRDPWFRYLMKIRRRVPCFLGPKGYGDGHYHVDFDCVLPRRAKFEVDGWEFDSFLRVFRKGVGDSVDGLDISSDAGFSAICASVSPKGARTLWDLTFDRRFFTIRRTRVLANFTWSGIDWGD
jgi:hypothetical protein